MENLIKLIYRQSDQLAKGACTLSIHKPEGLNSKVHTQLEGSGASLLTCLEMLIKEVAQTLHIKPSILLRVIGESSAIAGEDL